MRLWAIIGLLTLVVFGCSKSTIKTSSTATKPVTTSTGPSELVETKSASEESEAAAMSLGGQTTVAVDVAPGTNGPVKPTSDKLQVISFDDLNLGMPEDSKFRPMMLQLNDGRAKELLGCKINLGGHMNPPDALTGLTEFVLLKNKECKFGPGGQADHLIRVFMKDGETVNYTDKVVYVEGLLTLKPFPDEGPSTWSIYDVAATKVSTRPPPRQR